MTRDCTKATVLVEKMFDGEASRDERREAEGHLETCASCRAHLEFLSFISERARDSVFPEPPESYWEYLPRRVLTRIAEEPVPGFRRFFPRLFVSGGLRWAAPSVALLASLALVVAVGLRFARQSPWSGSPKATEEPRASAPHPLEVPAPAVAPEPDPDAVAQKGKEQEREPPAAQGLPLAPTPSFRAPEAASESESESESVAPPMARDEKLDAGRGQKSGSVEVANAARDRIDAARSRASAAPAAPVAPAESSSGKRTARAKDNPASSVLGVREEAATVSLAAGAAPEPSAGVARPEEAEAEAETEANCSALRASLAGWGLEAGESASANETRKRDIRYQLARCSIDRYQREGGEALRNAAIEDGDDFLAQEKEGIRADEVRAELGRIRPREKEN